MSSAPPRAPFVKSRAVAFTFWDPEEGDRQTLLDWCEAESDIRYCVFQLEAGEEDGRHHFQGFLELNCQRTFRWFRNEFPLGDGTAHLSSARVPAAAANYCMKEDTRVEGPWEYGTRGGQGSGAVVGANRKRKSDAIAELKEIKEKVKEGATMREIAEEYPGQFVRNYRGLVKYHEMFTPMEGIKENLNVSLFYGRTGTGKSRWARDIFRGQEYYVKPSGPWFDGYDGQENVIFDDYAAGWGMHLVDLLRCLDLYNDHRVPPKGSFTPWRASHIIFTTNILPRYWFEWGDEDEEEAEAVATEEREHGVVRPVKMRKRYLTRVDQRPALARRFHSVYMFQGNGKRWEISNREGIEMFFNHRQDEPWAMEEMGAVECEASLDWHVE